MIEGFVLPERLSGPAKIRLAHLNATNLCPLIFRAIVPEVTGSDPAFLAAASAAGAAS
jgi:hypothetical protein